MLLTRSIFKTFPDFVGTIYRNSLLRYRCITVNKGTYTDILRHLSDVVGRKSPEKWRTKRWFLFHDNAPAHRSDLAQADFYLLPRLKSTLKGQHFCDTTDIIKNGTEQLKRLSQKGFQECFQHLYSRPH